MTDKKHILDTQKKAWAKIVAKAWADENFKNQLVQNPDVVLEQNGMHLGSGKKSKILENTDSTINVVLPAHPSSKDEGEIMKEALGLSKNFKSVLDKAWADKDFKAKLLKDPTGVLKENGVVVPAGKQVKIVEQTATNEYFVIPAKPGNLQVNSTTPSLVGCYCSL